MPRPRIQTRTRARPAPSGADNYAGLERRLVLLDWLHHLLGYSNTPELLEDFKQAAEGFGPDGRSYAFHRLLSRERPDTIGEEDLSRYDDNIRSHLAKMNAGRSEPITLRYFQYLAALYAEIFLDHYFNRHAALLRSLNERVAQRNANRLPIEPAYGPFAKSDLKKLAFWMATGSGKTLIMHLNYRQFLHYNQEPLDNILLITPTEGLSDQHLAELQASGIPAARFTMNQGGWLGNASVEVQVTEITKLVIEKRGEGDTVPVEAFEGKNLIFVDEGHKGSGGEAWRRVRDALGETGFTFEYSATFGQALTAARNDELTAEYGKAIAFDYSYRYFYKDGYGKDFHILNLQQESTEGDTDTLLMANLLSFYEQQQLFTDQEAALRPYILEKPLWVFIGSTVNKKENSSYRSDVLTVVRFLHRLLANEGGWVTETIGRLLEGESGLVGSDGEDIFINRFRYLHQQQQNAASTYQDILDRVLHTGSGGGLHLCDIRGSDGELGLKASGARDYFGLIYIGDTGAFKRLVEADDTGIVVEEDVFSGSLFDGINEPATTIDVLIGAKKFMEGWNSWRVSNMGLLNIGRSEGSEIIQLFGRGVRLRGRDMTLKRSSALDGNHPDHLRLLETLNIFAVRANYMAQFRDYLEREGAPVNGMVELDLQIRPNQELLGKGLITPRLPEGSSFVEEERLVLDVDPAVTARVDLSLKVRQVVSSAEGISETAGAAPEGRCIPEESLSLIDWNDVYLKLLAHKESKGLGNMVVLPGSPERIIKEGQYQLVADDSVLCPSSFTAVRELQDAAVAVVLKYAEQFYRLREERWETNNVAYLNLGEKDPNFEDYTVRIPDNEASLINEVKKLIKEDSLIQREDSQVLPNVHFDRHLFQPLLVKGRASLETDPPGLNEGEQRFVKDLRQYCLQEKDGALFGKELFLLRNLSRGKGVGFFQNRGFYPDFILWVKSGKKQRIVFVEPHGMFHANAPEYEEKVQLYKKMKELNEAIGKRSGMRDVELDSFIVSRTPFSSLSRRYSGEWDRQRFAEEHILFPETDGEYDYLEKIITVTD